MEKGKKNNRQKEYDWKDEEREEFSYTASLYREKLKQQFEESSEEDYPDLATRIAEVNAECEEWEKEYLNLGISESEPEPETRKETKTSCFSRFFKKLKSLVCKD